MAVMQLTICQWLISQVESDHERIMDDLDREADLCSRYEEEERLVEQTEESIEEIKRYFG